MHSNLEFQDSNLELHGKFDCNQTNKTPLDESLLSERKKYYLSLIAFHELS